MKIFHTLNICIFSFALFATEGYAGWLDEIKNKATESIESVKNSAKKIPLPGVPGKKTTSNTDPAGDAAKTPPPKKPAPKKQSASNQSQTNANQKDENQASSSASTVTQASTEQVSSEATVRFEQLVRQGGWKEMRLHLSYKGVKLRISFPKGRRGADQQWVKVNYASAAEGGPLYLDFELLQKVFNVKPEEFKAFNKEKVLADVSIKLGDQVLPLRILAYKYPEKPAPSVFFSLGGGTNDEGGPYTNGAFVLQPILDAIKADGKASITVTNSRNPDFNSNGPISFDISTLRMALLEKPKKIIVQDDGRKDVYIAALPADIRNTTLVDYGDSQKTILKLGGSHQYINKHCFRAVYPYYFSSEHWKQIKKHIDYINKTFFSAVSDSQRFNQSNVSSICNKTTTITPKEKEVQAPHHPMAKLYYDKELSGLCSALKPTATTNQAISSTKKQCLDPKIPAEEFYNECKAGKVSLGNSKFTGKQCECVREKVQEAYESYTIFGWGSKEYVQSRKRALFACRKTQ